MATSWIVRRKNYENPGGFEGHVVGGKDSGAGMAQAVVFADDEEQALTAGAAQMGLVPSQCEAEWMGNPI